MKISIKNLGVLKEADFEIGDLTVICGQNNTGKTYLTHATYGFLSYFPHSTYAVDAKLAKQFVKSKNITLALTKSDLKRHLSRCAREYSRGLDNVFAGSESQFKDASFSVHLNALKLPTNASFSLKMSRNQTLNIHARQVGEQWKLGVSLDQLDMVADAGSEASFSSREIVRSVEQAVGRCIAIALGKHIPKAFIAGNDRTGDAVFQREIFSNRYKLVDSLHNGIGKVPAARFLREHSSKYPLAIDDDLQFIQSLPDHAKKASYILKKHPEILDDFTEIVGGTYYVTPEGDIRFIPASDRRLKLSLVTCSGAVRSLVDVAFYLKHVAQKGDLLMIDEPELNLHPDNQRRMARLIARLVNAGIKVFITTHSDYIVRELSVLIVLNQNDKRLKQLARDEKYDKSELLEVSQVRAYVTEPPPKAKNGDSRKISLSPVDVSAEYGIDTKSFNHAIDDMNRIQDEIAWGE